MSLSLNGSSQYVSLGNAVDIRSALPLTVAIVVGTAGLGAAGLGLYSQGDYNANTGHGAFLFGGPPKHVGNYMAPSGGSTQENDGSVITLAANSGWNLILLSLYATGSAPSIVMSAKAQIYNYTAATWSAQDGLGGISGLAVTATQAPASGQTTVVGANYIGGIANYFSGLISWVAVFSHDGGGGSSQIKDTALAAELAANGAWNSLDANCKLFIPFRGAAVDESGNGHHGTLVGSPTYGAAGPNELPAGGGGPAAATLRRLRQGMRIGMEAGF